MIAAGTAAGSWSLSASWRRQDPGRHDPPSGATAHDAPALTQSRAHPSNRRVRRIGSTRARRRQHPQPTLEDRPPTLCRWSRPRSDPPRTGRHAASARPDTYAPPQDQRLGPTGADTFPIARPPPAGSLNPASMRSRSVQIITLAPATSQKPPDSQIGGDLIQGLGWVGGQPE